MKRVAIGALSWVAIAIAATAFAADESDPPETAETRLAVWRSHDRDAADVLVDGEGRPRLIYRFWGHRWVRAEFDADGDGRRDVFGVSDFEGHWRWYRSEDDDFVTCAIKPQSEDPLSQAFRKAVADLVERRVRYDDGEPVDVREGEGPVFDVGPTVLRLEIRLRHNPPTADPIPSEAATTRKRSHSNDDFAPPIPPPPSREEILSGEVERRSRLSAILLPPFEAPLFGVAELAPPFAGTITDALETPPGVPAGVRVVAYPYRVFEPATVTLAEGHTATRVQLCFDAAIRGYLRDRFCLDADLSDSNPVFLTTPASDISGRSWGVWDVEIRHSEAR